MTMQMGLFLIALTVIAASAWLYWESSRARRWGGRASYGDNELRWMPSELQTARLATSERNMRVVLNGQTIPVRPDQVYRTATGTLIPVETKVRRSTQVYEYDVIELSLQRLALAQSATFLGNAVPGMRGYVRIRDQSGRRLKPIYRAVDLWPEDRLAALHQRYEGIVAGHVRPTCQTNPRACSGCGYRDLCPARAA